MKLIQRINIGPRLGFAFAVVMLLLLAAVAAGMRGMSSIGGDLETMYKHRAVPVQQLGEINKLLLRNRVLVMDMMANPEADNLAKRDKELKSNVERVGETWAAFINSDMTPQTRRKAEAFIEQRKRYVGEGLLPIRDAMLAGRHQEARRVYHEVLSPVAAHVTDTLGTLVNDEIEAGRLDYERAQADASKLLTAALWLAASALAAGAALAWSITRSITRPLAEAVHIAETVAKGDLTSRVTIDARDETGRLLGALQNMVDNLARVVSTVRTSSDSIATGSSQIATGNLDLSQRTEEQASNLQQTAASMEQISGTVRQNADSARQAAELAQASSQVAVHGGEVVAEVVRTMEDISVSSRRIADISSVIDGIAFQTNLLALNAAVEAARAGEQGRGFAVVAGEVRTLAQRSAQAAKEIKGLVEQGAQRVETGTRLVGDAGNTMQDIVAQSRRVADLINEISSATVEQTSGIGQVSHAVTQLDQVTQQNAALVEESAAAADSLRAQAAKLVEAVQVFRLEPQAA